MSNNTINLIGWILFIISAIGFIISSIGSFWAMFGSVFFLVACLVFLMPFFAKLVIEALKTLQRHRLLSAVCGTTLCFKAGPMA